MRIVPIAGGRVSPATLSWIRRALADARDAGVPVIAFLHHGLTEHFPGQGSFESFRIVAGSERLNRILAQGGARVVFTGHGHAQDVSVASAGGGWLIDVETGSLSSYPDPWRMVSLGPDHLARIRSRFVTATAAMPDGFPRYSRARLRQGILEALVWGLGRAGVRSEDAARLAGQAARTIELYFAGDEQAGEIRLDTRGMRAWGAMVGKFLEEPLESLGSDRPPPDNDLLIDLAALANEMRLRRRGASHRLPRLCPGRTGAKTPPRSSPTCPGGVIQSRSTARTWAPDGPWRSHSMKACREAGSASAHTSTSPTAVFRTVPRMPRLLAARSVA